MRAALSRRSIAGPCQSGNLEPALLDPRATSRVLGEPEVGVLGETPPPSFIAHRGILVGASDIGIMQAPSVRRPEDSLLGSARRV